MSDGNEIRQERRLRAHRDYLASVRPLTERGKKEATNIIMVFMDDLGWGDLSCFGSHAIKTPHLDRMAEEGLVMENCYASSPVCSPSRFGLLTGRYPTRGLIENVFFPTVPVDDTYITPSGYERDDETPQTHRTQIRNMYRQFEKKSKVNGILEDELTIAEILQARGYRTGMFGKWHLGDQSPHLPNDKGFDHFFGAHYSNDMYPYHFWRNRDIAIEAPLDQRRITECLNEELFEFISSPASAPFFAYYASPWPHHPISSGEQFKGTSKAGTYGDCIEEFDHGMGALLSLLEEQGILDRTLIVFTSDNGPWHQGSPGGHRGRKGNVFDGGQVVPTICHWPGKIESKTVSAQAMNIDFMPTFCEIAGVKLPQDREIDGRSLLPLWLGDCEESPHDHLIYINSLVPIEENQGYAVRTKDNFKYYQAACSENAAYEAMKIHPFLFDLNHDRDESYDVRALYPEKARRLELHLEKFNQDLLQNPRGWRSL